MFFTLYINILSYNAPLHPTDAVVDYTSKLGVAMHLPLHPADSVPDYAV